MTTLEGKLSDFILVTTNFILAKYSFTSASVISYFDFGVLKLSSHELLPVTKNDDATKCLVFSPKSIGSSALNLRTSCCQFREIGSGDEFTH